MMCVYQIGSIFYFIVRTKITGFLLADGRGACQGDSGGPLVVQGVQIAVTSFVASAGCQRSLPSGFARVSNFRSWISQNTGV